MIPLNEFKELMNVKEITFNQYTEEKRAFANVRGIKVIVAKNFDEKKPAYLKKGLEDKDGKILDPEAYVIFNAKDAIRSFTL